MAESEWYFSPFSAPSGRKGSATEQSDLPTGLLFYPDTRPGPRAVSALNTVVLSQCLLPMRGCCGQSVSTQGKKNDHLSLQPPAHCPGRACKRGGGLWAPARPSQALPGRSRLARAALDLTDGGIQNAGPWGDRVCLKRPLMEIQRPPRPPPPNCQL